MTEHVHEWVLDAYRDEESGILRVEMFCWYEECRKRHSRAKAEAMLNEYETLKAATEMWTAEDARRLSNTCMSMQGKAIHGKGYPSLRESAIAYWKSRVAKLLAYANILEGK